MTDHSRAIGGIELEQFMDRLEAEDQGSEPLLAQLRAQPLRADSLVSIDRLHSLWMNAGDATAARAVLDQDGDALLAVVPSTARGELQMNLNILRLRVANFLDQDSEILKVLESLDPTAGAPLDFDIEHYRRHRIFNELEQGSLEVALKTIDARYALTLINPARELLRSWDATDRHRRRSLVLWRHERPEEAREAALEAVSALRASGPEQDVDANDWVWLGNSLIEIIPLRLALFEQPVTQLTAGLSQPQRREWDVRLARLTARAQHALGDLPAALKICTSAALSLDSDGGDNFIEYELPWLMENRQVDAAGHRAFIDIYEMRGEMWPGTARLVHERLHQTDDPSVWWPLCVMRACNDHEVLQNFLVALPEIDTSVPAPTPLLDALYRSMEDPQAHLDNVFAEARAEAQRRSPEHPWITRLTAVYDAGIGAIDAATELALLQGAIQAGRMQDNRSAYALFCAQVKTLGLIEALQLPVPTLPSGMYAYNYAASIDDLVEKETETLPEETRDQAYTLLRYAQKAVYEQGQANMERYFSTGSGHPFDACAHLYSMLCNNLAINYRFYNGQNLYQEAIELHLRGIAASSFAEHYQGLLSNRIGLEDNPGIVDAAEQLWHYAREYGYSRHAPDDYLQSVVYALYQMDRDGEIPIWLERALKWQEDQGISDEQLSVASLFARLQVARYLAHANPENAYGLWLRYEPHVHRLQDNSLMSSAVYIFKALGRNDEAIDYCHRTLALCAPDVDYDVRCRGWIQTTLAELQAPEKPAGKSWWQIWK